MYKLKFLLLVAVSSTMFLQISWSAQNWTLKRSGRSFADHSKFKELQRPFESMDEVMKACATCHNQSKEHIQEIMHWTWACNDKDQRVPRDAINPHLENGMDYEDVQGNCLDCHRNFQIFSSVSASTEKKHLPKVDCLVCHDVSNSYFSKVRKSGKESISLDQMRIIAKNIDNPANTNCGNCHLSDNHTKYNDFPKDISSESFNGDVHMGANGQGFRCKTCHTTFKHMISSDCKATSLGHKHLKKIKGKDEDYNKIDMASCESCHGISPHKDGKLNDHIDVVACQTCHIMKKNEGDITTEFHWYDGLTRSSKSIKSEDGNEFILKNYPLEGRRPESRVFPFKVVQDVGKDGEKIKTYWPMNHLVMPAKQAMKCNDCHKKDSVIMGSIDEGPYIPGNYGLRLPPYFNIDYLAILGIFAVFFGVSIHAIGRIVTGLMRNMK